MGPVLTPPPPRESTGRHASPVVHVSTQQTPRMFTYLPVRAWRELPVRALLPPAEEFPTAPSEAHHNQHSRASLVFREVAWFTAYTSYMPTSR